MFLDSLRSGGKERRLVELLKNLRQMPRFECSVASMSTEVHYKDIFELQIPVHYLIRKVKKDPRILLQLYRLCREFRPDIVHTWDSMTAMYALPVCKLMGIRMVNGMITDAPAEVKPFSKGWLRARVTFPLSDLVLSNSQAGLISYKAPASKSRCIYNGFDFARVEQLAADAEIRSRFGIMKKNVVIMVASFSDNKDYATFVSVAQSVLSKRQDVAFLAVGDGIHLEATKAAVGEEFRNRIIFAGKQVDVESLVNVSAIAVLFTNNVVHGEGISNSILEYMALGKPVVATESGGNREIVLTNETGFLVGYRDVPAAASRINFLLDNESTAHQMGRKGRERVERSFSIVAMVNGFVDAYRSVAN